MTEDGRPSSIQDILAQPTHDKLVGQAASRIFPEIAPERIANIMALGDWVCIKPDPAPASVGLIAIPEGSQRKAGRGRNGRGTVVAVGPGLLSKRGRLIPCELKPGDRIAFSEGCLRDEISGYVFTREYGGVGYGAGYVGIFGIIQGD